MKYSFQFTLFGKKVQMFNDGDMGIVIEKEPQVVCVYGTSRDHQNIFCAIPLCHPKYLKGVEYTVEFCSDARAKISAGEIKIVIDFANKKCANNRAFRTMARICGGGMFLPLGMKAYSKTLLSKSGMLTFFISFRQKRRRKQPVFFFFHICKE